MRDATRQARTGTSAVTSIETAAAPYHLTNSTDVVYVVKPGDDNESLRYSLRSLANIPHGKVIISGYKPFWVKNVIAIYKDQEDIPDQQNSNENLLLAADMIPDLSDDFLFMNDDFFITQPTDTIPVMHQGDLDAVIQRYKTGNRYHQAYSLVTTKRELIAHNIGPELLSYELHMPMMFNRKLLVDMIKGFGQPLFALRPRTCYGNMYKLKGVYQDDAKDITNQEASRFVSTGADFDISRAGELVRARYPNAGPYES